MKDLKLQNLMPAKDCLIHFERGLTFKKKVKITEEAASTDQEAADEFPNAIKKITEEKGYLPKQLLDANKISYSWVWGESTKDIY